MAQNQNAPGAGSVPDPGGPSFPVNSAQTVGVGYSPASASSGAPAGGVQRSGSTLPLNSPSTQGVGAPGPWSAPASGSFPTVSTVSDPGGASCVIGQTQTMGYGSDPSVPAGGDPGATGGYVPGPTQAGALWSQFNISGNPNPGALSGGASGTAPSYLPGQTATNQVSPQANP